MPVEHTVNPTQRLVISTVRGRFSSEEMFQLDHLIRNDPEVRPEFNQLIDLADVTENVVNPADLRALNQRAPYFRSDTRRAVVGTDLLIYGKMRMFELLRDGVAGQWRYFTDREEAQRWLAESDSVGGPAAPD